MSPTTWRSPSSGQPRTDRPLRLEHVALTVADRERSARFYAEHLRLTDRVHDDEHLLIPGSPTGGLLALSEGDAPPALPRTTHFGFQADRPDLVHAARAAFRAAGVEEAEWQESGPTRVQVFDPDGYRVEIYAFSWRISRCWRAIRALLWGLAGAGARTRAGAGHLAAHVRAVLTPCRPCGGGNPTGDPRPTEDDSLGVVGAGDALTLLPRLIRSFGRASGPRHPPIVTAAGCAAQVVSELGIPAEKALRPLLLDVRVLFERRADARGQPIEGQLSLLLRPAP